ncbi:MAG: carbohydrate ABC transporter permease, partial [Firmicutes bacterium]|nr:carbohydrate ABC transporter permease [Bacillota bacterium]
MRIRWKGSIATLVTYLIVIFYVFPAIWMVLTGFKTENAAYAAVPSLFFKPTLSQFALAFHSGFGSFLSHSVESSLISTAIAMVLGVPAAFAMVFHMPKKSGRNILFFVLATRFMPFAAIIVPLYIIFLNMHLLDTVAGLVLVYTSMNLPLIIWMARSYFLDIPEEIIEASRVDGC